MSTSLIEILRSSNSPSLTATERDLTLLVLEFLEHIRSVDPPGKWKILVVDEHSQKLLSFVLSTYDVLAENVSRT